MRIGELAALTGTTPRAVRHYHRIGLLPEPPRQPNGYRAYGLRDAVRLAHIRRLTALGLSLDEARGVLTDESGNSLVEVLQDLDAELARQEDAIRRRRERLTELLDQARADGGLPAESPVSPELAALFNDLARCAARLPGPEPDMAVRERELMSLLEGTVSGGSREWLSDLVDSMRTSPQAVEHALDLYRRLDELAGAPVDDPRVGQVATAIVDAVPPDLARSMTGGAPEGPASGAGDGGFAEAFFADFAPAQAAAIQRAMELLWERAR